MVFTSARSMLSDYACVIICEYEVHSSYLLIDDVYVTLYDDIISLKWGNSILGRIQWTYLLAMPLTNIFSITKRVTWVFPVPVDPCKDNVNALRLGPCKCPWSWLNSVLVAICCPYTFELSV